MQKKTVLFNTSIGPLSCATIPGQSGPRSDGNEGVLRIPQSSSITGTSPSDCLVSYPGHSLGGVLPLCREAVDVFYSLCRLDNKLYRKKCAGINVHKYDITLFISFSQFVLLSLSWLLRSQYFDLCMLRPSSSVLVVVINLQEISNWILYSIPEHRFSCVTINNCLP